MTLKLSDVDLKKANLHYVWTVKDIAIENGIYTAVVPKHGVVPLRIQNSHLNIR